MDLIERLAASPVGELKPGEYLAMARALKDGSGSADAVPLRVAVLSSFSFNFVDPFLVVEGFRAGYDVRSYYGPFGQLEQLLGNDESPLHSFAPDVLVLAFRLEDVDIDAAVRYHASRGARLRDISADLLHRLTGSIQQFRQRYAAPVLVANFALPSTLPLTVFDANALDSVTTGYHDASRQLAEALEGIPGAVVWDYAGLVRDRGAGDWTDQRLWVLARNPVAAGHQPFLASHLLRTIHGTLHSPAKCLVLDADNTLWGGVVGDDGIDGIQLGDDFPGNTYKRLQRAVLALRDRGVLIALASKNEQSVVEEVFRTHEEMLLRWDDLAATRINWEPKSANIRSIAKELNIGSDALVLFDDNPVERAEVRANAPEARVVEVPRDSSEYERVLAGIWWFDTPSLSDEDRRRAGLYGAERQRRHFGETAASVAEFLEGLEMEAEVGQVGPTTIARVAQLVGKTNQFNLTTRRHRQAEIAEMAADPDWVVGWLRLRDRFGDAGLVAVGIVRREAESAIVDTLLMSCRVMGRQVEQAMLSYLVEQARALACTEVVGDYYPTKKNAMVADLYPRFGFTSHHALDGGGTRYVLPISGGAVAWPEMIRRRDAAPVVTAGTGCPS